MQNFQVLLKGNLRDKILFVKPFLKRGDVANIAKETGVSSSFVSSVLNFSRLQVSNRVEKALLAKAFANTLKNLEKGEERYRNEFLRYFSEYIKID